MKAKLLEKENIQEFMIYCKRHRAEVDDSFLYDEDLDKFELNDDNPSYVITDDHGNIKATASLILDEYNRSGKKGRFRIFHSELHENKVYEHLLYGILKHTEGIKKIYTYVPTYNKELMDMIPALGFEIERYIFLLVREEDFDPEFQLPDGYTIKSLELDQDEELWCHVRNSAFSSVTGNETPVTPQMVRKMVLSEDSIEGGTMLLYHGHKAVGCVRCSSDEYENAPIINIGALAVLPEYQGKGLGRLLLRAALKFARDNSYNRTYLCVNAENEKAKSLYIQEGFKQVEAVACYYYET